MSRDAAAEYSTAAYVYSLTSQHKLHSRIGDDIIIILVYNNNILRKSKRLITMFRTDVKHKVML